MVDWIKVKTKKINKISYRKLTKSMFIDFVGSETDAVISGVPEEIFNAFIEAKSPDQFYEEFVDGYFEVAIKAHFSDSADPKVTLFANHHKKSSGRK